MGAPAMSFPVHAYGFMLALAFIAGILLGIYHGRQLGYSTDRVLDLAVWLLISAMVGARALYIVLYPQQFPTYFSWFAFTQGGLVFFGGFLGATITVIAYGRWHGLGMRDLGDMIAPCLIMGHAIGRIGCFLNGCCYGSPTSLRWGVVFERLGDHLPRHPTQLYEAFFLLCLFVVAVAAFRNRIRGGAVFPGGVWGGYVFLYSNFRFAIEYIREDDRGGFFTSAGLSVSQCVSLAGLAGSLIWLEVCRRKNQARSIPGGNNAQTG